MNEFISHLSKEERKQIKTLDTPVAIQDWLNTIPYSDDEFYRCPLRVLRDRKGHCFDGALFAAATLRLAGYPPLLVELIPNDRDDDHMLAVFKRDHCWGAVAQSNFSGLRYREPVYRSMRELVMSYFEDFFNPLGEKTMRGYRGPFNLSVFDSLNWMVSDDLLDELADGMDRYRIFPVISKEMEASLAPVDKRSLQAGLMGSIPAGLFKVE